MAMTVKSMANDSMAKVMTKIATGKRINSAADDAAGLAISQKLKSVASGYEVGTNNSVAMGNLLDTADSALSGVGDMLGRIRELGVQASNGLLSADDKKVIQSEIDQIKQEIDKTAGSTEYNTMKLLDGTFAGKHLASNPDGSGMDVTLESSAVSALGIAEFDVTGNFDLSDIDKAIDKISQNRASIGSITNTIGHIVNSNSNAYINQISSLSQIESQDMAQAAAELNKQKALSQLELYNIQRQNDKKKDMYSIIM